MSTSQSAPNSGKLSLRSSVLVWVGGAVFGWVFLMVSFYTILRDTDEQSVDRTNGINASGQLVGDQSKKLNDIAPASGNTTEDEPVDPIDEETDNPS